MTKQGHVKVQAKDKWNQRYLAFDLSHGTNGALALYHKENQRKLDTLYDLTDIIWCKDLKQPPAKSPTQFCFELLGNGFGKQIFAVDSANDRTAWVTAITGIKGVQAKRGDISTLDKPTSDKPRARGVTGTVDVPLLLLILQEVQRDLLRQNGRKASFSSRFNEAVDPTYRPLLSLTYEKQVANSGISRNPQNPAWKDNFVFNVSSIASGKLNLKIYNDSPNRENLMAEGNILTAALEDEKQRVEEAELKGDRFTGNFTITWRFETAAVEQVDEVDEREVIGTFQVTVYQAVDLKPRLGGSLREVAAIVTYGKQTFTSKTHAPSLEPTLNFGTIFKVRDPTDFCTVRIVDVDGAMRTHLGSVVLTKDELVRSRSTESVEVRFRLQLERGDNPADNAVGGELILKYRYQDSVARRQAAAPPITGGIKADLNNIPVEFPPGPPEEWKNIPAPAPGSMPVEQLNRTLKTNIKKKYIRNYWEEQLGLYQSKKAAGDWEATSNLLRAVVKNLNLLLDAEHQEEMNDTNPLLFPSRPRTGDPLVDTEAWNAWRKDKFLMDAWDNSWAWYQQCQRDRDKDGMMAAVKKIKETFSQHGAEYRKRYSTLNRIGQGQSPVPSQPQVPLRPMRGNTPPSPTTSSSSPPSMITNPLLQSGGSGSVEGFSTVAVATKPLAPPKIRARGDRSSLQYSPDQVAGYLGSGQSQSPHSGGRLVPQRDPFAFGEDLSSGGSSDPFSDETRSTGGSTGGAGFQRTASTRDQGDGFRRAVSARDGGDGTRTPRGNIGGGPQPVRGGFRGQQRERDPFARADDDPFSRSSMEEDVFVSNVLAKGSKSRPNSHHALWQSEPDTTNPFFTGNNEEGSIGDEFETALSAFSSASPQPQATQPHAADRQLQQQQQQQRAPAERARSLQTTSTPMYPETTRGPFSIETAVPDQLPGAHDMDWKIVILGNSGVGKTTVLGRWIDNQFTVTSATISVEFSNKSFRVDDKLVKVQLWDTAGQEKFRALTQNYYRNAKGAILVYDITNLESFTNLESWLDALRNAQGNEGVKIMLIGNKADMSYERKVTEQTGLKWAKDHGLYFLETSAKDGMNVHRAFQMLLQEIYEDQSRFSGAKGSDFINPLAGGGVVISGGNEQTEDGDCC